MENKDIEKAAREYAEKYFDAGCRIQDEEQYLLDGFAAGADHITIEIGREIMRYQQDIIDGLGREEIARKIISDKRKEIDELVEALEEATRWIPVSKWLPEEGRLVLVKEDDTDIIDFVAYDLAAHNGEYWALDDNNCVEIPTHWRPIDTPKATQLLEKYGKK